MVVNTEGWEACGVEMRNAHPYLARWSGCLLAARELTLYVLSKSSFLAYSLFANTGCNCVSREKKTN